MRDFVGDPLGHGLYMAVQAGYGFQGADDARDLTELQLQFLHHAEIERQRRFLEGLGEMLAEMFSE